MALEHVRIGSAPPLAVQLRSVSTFARQLRDQVRFVFGVMNDCYVDTGTVANNDYGELEVTFGIVPSGTSIGNTSKGYIAWYKVASLKDELDGISAQLDAAIHDLA